MRFGCLSGVKMEHSMDLIPAWPAPDHPSWRHHRDYSPAWSVALFRAFELLAVNRIDAYVRAVDLIKAFLSERVVAPQRLRVCYIMAVGLTSVEVFRESLNWLDEALELAINLEDNRAVLDLILLRSALNRNLLQFAEAAADLQAVLALLDSEPPERQIEHKAMRLVFTVRLAGVEYFLGHYVTAQTYVDIARELTHEVPNALLDAATAQWVQTHLYRLRGRPEDALYTALATANAFSETPSPNSAARAQALVAETAMDIAAKLAVFGDSGSFLKLAWRHLRLATDFAKEAQDVLGENMVALARIRYERMRRADTNRIVVIEQVIQIARNEDDIALLAGGVTALADELAARGERESALNYYRQVLALLDGSDVPAVGIDARRALLLDEEWQT
jgi:tetratricopeptide (TPR) repeat protein